MRRTARLVTLTVMTAVGLALPWAANRCIARRVEALRHAWTEEDQLVRQIAALKTALQTAEATASRCQALIGSPVSVNDLEKAIRSEATRMGLTTEPTTSSREVGVTVAVTGPLPRLCRWLDDLERHFPGAPALRLECFGLDERPGEAKLRFTLATTEDRS